jgi:hypothetical protein
MRIWMGLLHMGRWLLGQGAVTTVNKQVDRAPKAEFPKRAANQARDMAVNSPRDSLNVCPGSGPDVQKRDDMAPRRTRSATSFALPYGRGSVANEALRTLRT